MKKTNATNNLYIEMENMVKKAIVIIQDEASHFSQKTKTHYSGSEDDLVTSADIKAQAMYVEDIQTLFPGEGLIGEENGLNIEAEVGYGYFTIDPLDGTKAFGRLQSTGGGRMIAHVQNGIVDAICIGDINTGEIYGFGPGHEPTRTRFGVKTVLKIDTSISLNKKYVILRDNPKHFPDVLQKMLDIETGGLFKDMEITSGSIGLNVARLWKNETAMLIFKTNSFDTPWDNTPIIGMNKVLDIVHIKFDPITLETEIIEPEIPKDVVKRKWIEILTHKDYANEIMNWIKENK